MNDVVPQELEIRPAQQMRDIGFLAGKEVVDADHIVPLFDEPFAQMRAQKAGAAGHQNAFMSSHVRVISRVRWENRSHSRGQCYSVSPTYHTSPAAIASRGVVAENLAISAHVVSIFSFLGNIFAVAANFVDKVCRNSIQVNRSLTIGTPFFSSPADRCISLRGFDHGLLVFRAVFVVWPHVGCRRGGYRAGHGAVGCLFVRAVACAADGRKHDSAVAAGTITTDGKLPNGPARRVCSRHVARRNKVHVPSIRANASPDLIAARNHDGGAVRRGGIYGGTRQKRASSRSANSAAALRILQFLIAGGTGPALYFRTRVYHSCEQFQTPHLFSQ